MARKKSWNPESHAWKGKSYKKGGKRVRDCRESAKKKIASPDKE